MKMLVTGGAGFIGSHLAEALLAQGAEVHVIDNLSTGNRDYLPKNAALHTLDIQSEEAAGLIKRLKPDIVFHEAAQVDVQRSVKDPAYDAIINIIGAANTLQACCEAGVKKVVYASSCAVYGELTTALIHEQDPARPISFYGISKRTPELYLRVFHKLYGLNYTILRYANVFGPRQTPKGEGGVISIYMDRIKKGTPLVVFGDGEQTRDFVYVKDVVRANLAAVRQGDGEIIQIGTALPTSIKELLMILQDIHGEPLLAVHQPERPGDIRHSCLSNIRAFESLGWKPTYDLYRGLQETYQYVMNQG